MRPRSRSALVVPLMCCKDGSAADDARNHQNLLGLGIELADALGGPSRCHLHSGSSALALLLEDALRLLDGGDCLRISGDRCTLIPRQTIVTMMRQYS